MASPSIPPLNGTCPANQPPGDSVESTKPYSRPDNYSDITSNMALGATRGGFIIPILLSGLGIGCTPPPECNGVYPKITSEKGFEPNNEDIEFIYDTLDLLRATVKLEVNGEDFFCGIKGIKIVEKIKDHDKDDGYGNPVGEYKKRFENGIIYIEYDFLKKHNYETLFAIAHEVGHHIQNRMDKNGFEESINQLFDISLTDDDSAYLDGIPGAVNSEKIYGKKKEGENFATVFSYHAFAPLLLEELANQNTDLKAKADFMEKYFPYQKDVEFKSTSHLPFESKAIEAYKPGSIYLDEADGTTWFVYDGGTRSESTLHIDKKGEITNIGNLYELLENSEFDHVSNGELAQVALTPYSDTSSRAFIDVWLTDLADGTQARYRSSLVTPSHVEILDYDYWNQALYYRKNDKIYRWNLGQENEHEEIYPGYSVRESDSYVSGKNTPNYFYYIDTNKDEAKFIVYDKDEKTNREVILPDYFFPGYYIPLEDKIIMLGYTEPFKGYIFDPETNTFTKLDTGITVYDEAPSYGFAKTFYVEWKEGQAPVFRILNPGATQTDDNSKDLYDYYLETSQIGVVIPDNSTTQNKESISISFESSETDYLSSDGRVIQDKILGLFYFVDNEIYTDSSGERIIYIKTYNPEESFYERVGVKIPDSVSTVDTAFWNAVNGELYFSNIENDNIYYYKIDWSAFEAIEVGAIEETANNKYVINSFSNASYYDPISGQGYLFSCSINFNEGGTVSGYQVQGYNPDSGSILDIPLIPLAEYEPITVLENNGEIYLVTTNWILVYEVDTLETGRYTKAIPVDLGNNAKPENFLIHNNRPIYIEEGSERRTYIITDLLTGTPLDFSTSYTAPEFFSSDGDWLYGFLDNNDITKTEVRWIIEN